MVDNHWLVILYGAAISRNITLKTAKQTCSNNVCFHLESVFWLPRLAILLVYHLRCHLNHFSLARDIHHMKNASPNFQHLNQPYLATNPIFSSPEESACLIEQTCFFLAAPGTARPSEIAESVWRKCRTLPSW